MNTVFVPLPDGRALAMDLEAYREALAQGRELAPKDPPSKTEAVREVLDAKGMQDRTGVPMSWWLEAARRGDVPHIKAGKYVRFDFVAAIEALERR